MLFVLDFVVFIFCFCLCVGVGVGLWGGCVGVCGVPGCVFHFYFVCLSLTVNSPY